MQGVSILKESDQLQVIAYLKQEELVIALLNKETGQFYQSIFIYDALPKIIKEQTENITELFEFMIQKKEEITYKNQLIELQIQCGLRRKKKVVQLFLLKQEAIPTQFFQRQLKTYKTEARRLSNEVKQERQKGQRLFQNLKQKELQIENLLKTINQLRKTQIQKTEKFEQSQKNIVEMKKKIDQQQRRIVMYEQQQKELKQKKKIKQIETYNKKAEEPTTSFLENYCQKQKQLNFQAKKRNRQSESTKRQTNQNEQSQQNSNINKSEQLPSLVENFGQELQNRKKNNASIKNNGQLSQIIQQSQQGSFLTTISNKKVVDHIGNEARENHHLQPKVQDQRQKKNKKTPPHLSKSEVKPKKSEEYNYLSLKFNLSQYTKQQKQQLFLTNILHGLKNRDLTVLYNQKPFIRQGNQTCELQVNHTDGNDLYLGLSVQKNDINDELKVFLRSDGMISCRGRPTNGKKKRIASGVLVRFKISFKLETLEIKIGGEIVDSFRLPKAFVTRDVYFFVKLMHSASINYFNL